MSKQPYQTKQPVLQQKAQPQKTAKQNEADKKLEKSKIASVISSKPERSRAHRTD
ncbi:MAG: hypothetical protein SFX19_05380 [Alphaproteobacteria bacterium]|nr:hypothetical protein [Alphaproteobacteria bacterium]